VAFYYRLVKQKELSHDEIYQQIYFRQCADGGSTEAGDRYTRDAACLRYLLFDISPAPDVGERKIPATT
jgi:hypothetical protein